MPAVSSPTAARTRPFRFGVQAYHAPDRRGWQRLILEERLRDGPIAQLEPSVWRDLLETKVHVGGVALSFLYSRNQEYEADLFAYHLCRNSRFPVDECLDGMRLVALLRHPQAATREDFRPRDTVIPPALAYYLSPAADPLVRLRRLG